jgi:hypothetical protein
MRRNADIGEKYSGRELHKHSPRTRSEGLDEKAITAMVKSSPAKGTVPKGDVK